VLINVYRIRDAVTRARAPYLEPWEYCDRPARTVDQRQPDPDDLAYAYQKRLRPVTEAGSELDVDLLEAEAVWGSLLAEATGDLRECIVELSVSIDHYVEGERGANLGPETLAHARRVIWPSPSGHPDEYRERIARVVSSFNERVRGFLQRTRRSG